MKSIKMKELFMKSVDNTSVIILLGFLWTLTSLPIISVGASTCALNYAMIDYMENGQRQVMKVFFDALKANLKQATKLWLLYLLLIFVLMVDMLFYSQTEGALLVISTWVAGILLLMIFGQFLFVFHYIACFNATNKEAVRLIGNYLKKYPVVILLIILFSSLILLGVLIYVPFVGMFVMGFIAFVNSRFYIGMFKRGAGEKMCRKMKFEN